MLASPAVHRPGTRASPRWAPVALCRCGSCWSAVPEGYAGGGVAHTGSPGEPEMTLLVRNRQGKAATLRSLRVGVHFRLLRRAAARYERGLRAQPESNDGR